MNQKTYPKEVLEIHQEFKNSANLFLSEVNRILNSPPKQDKGIRLRILGFEQAQEVEKKNGSNMWYRWHDEETEIQFAQRIKYLEFAYPNHKFITEAQVKEICTKYNLVCGEIFRYKGFVPEINLTAIENFKIKNEDAGKDTLYIGQGDYDWDREYSESPGLYAKYRIEERKSKMKICAPMKDMDVEGVKIEAGYKMENIIPDPVVLQPVKGGYLIVTAWGDEASDEIIVNQNHN